MEEDRFDQLTKAMTQPLSRRGVLKILLAGVAGSILGLDGVDRSSATGPPHVGPPGGGPPHVGPPSGGSGSGVKACPPCTVGVWPHCAEEDCSTYGPCQKCNPRTSSCEPCAAQNLACDDATGTCVGRGQAGPCRVVDPESGQLVPCYVMGQCCDASTGACLDPNKGESCPNCQTCHNGTCRSCTSVGKCCYTSGGGIGVCVDACPSPLTCCNGNCVDLTSDANNCNACGRKCPSGTCQGGKCVNCTSNVYCNQNGTQVCCNGVSPMCCESGTVCVDTNSDIHNCGGCGQACVLTGAVCQGGKCICAATGLPPDPTTGCNVKCTVNSDCTDPNNPTCCNGTCTNTLTDTQNCHTCGNVCASGATCNNGSCSCLGINGACTTYNNTCGDSCPDSTCCSGHCGANDLCCYAIGQTGCVNDTDCCGSFTICQNGTCVACGDVGEQCVTQPCCIHYINTCSSAGVCT